MRGVSLAVVAGLLLAGCADDRPSDEPVDDFGKELEVTADTGAIRGVVIDPTIRPVVGVDVTIQSLDLTTTTDEEGRFGFSKVAPGLHFLQFSKVGYNSTQTSTTVEAGIGTPPLVTVQMTPNPSTQPRIVPLTYDGYLACGAAIVATSVGCTTWGPIADATDSVSVVHHPVDDPALQWTQGELVWDHTQAAGGMLIWEIVLSNQGGATQGHSGYRETGESPALAYLDDTVVAENLERILEDGVDYRFFGGPHPACTGVGFGCGLTIDQATTAYVHDFYNMVPREGWRYTVDGDHPVPT